MDKTIELVWVIDDEGWLIGEMPTSDASADSDLVFVETPPPQPCLAPRWDGNDWLDDETALLKLLLNNQQESINEACDSAISQLKAGYPSTEVETWARQADEARAYSENPSASVPLLSGMAAARGIDLANLVARVRSNADAWTQAIGALIGKRQALEDRLLGIDLESDIARDQLLAVSWD